MVGSRSGAWWEIGGHAGHNRLTIIDVRAAPPTETQGALVSNPENRIVGRELTGVDAKALEATVRDSAEPLARDATRAASHAGRAQSHSRRQRNDGGRRPARTRNRCEDGRARAHHEGA